ncbi:hypothetical protein, partial [Bradyrhizobium retamae]|uniref:hypothetical protein n=2 Tax=Bradyrhizobium TaxID=374 RepID=UPI000ACE13C2
MRQKTKRVLVIAAALATIWGVAGAEAASKDECSKGKYADAAREPLSRFLDLTVLYNKKSQWPEVLMVHHSDFDVLIPSHSRMG